VRFIGGLRSLLLAMLVVAAAVLTAVRILQPEQGWAVRAVAFAPYGLLLWGAVLLHTILRVLTGPRRPLWVAAAVVVAVPCGLHAWWLAPSYVGAPPPPAADATSVRLMTANLLAGGGDGIDLVSAATRADADLLVVEEITADALSDMEAAGLADAFPHRVGEPGARLEGLMIFSAYPLTDPVSLDLALGGWAATAATPDGPLRVLGVHPQPPVGDVEVWLTDQEAVRAAAGGTDVVAGDLNATPDHDSLQRLADDGFGSAAVVANEGWQPTWPAGGSVRVLGVPLPALVQIDHVLVGRRVAVLEVRAVEIAGSDHRAVVAELALR